MEPNLGLYFDGNFNGELFCIECYSEDDENWGVVVLQMDGINQPAIVTTRKMAQKALEKIEIINAELKTDYKVRITRYLRG